MPGGKNAGGRHRREIMKREHKESCDNGTVLYLDCGNRYMELHVMKVHTSKLHVINTHTDAHK